MEDLKNRVALVTGGSRGIGAGIALALARAGADVAVNYRQRADAANTVCAEITALGRKALVARPHDDCRHGPSYLAENRALPRLDGRGVRPSVVEIIMRSQT
jgi:NAD(P)-dependent dehydrogenase (short-subunit alcohol dehydrogenase family)